MLVFKTLLLLLPLAACILQTPIGDKVFLFGGIFAMAELCRIKGAIWELKRAWPLVFFIIFYIFIRSLAPVVTQLQDTYNCFEAIYSLVYSVPAGFCLYFWNRDDAKGMVFLGYVLFCLGLVIPGYCVINSPGAEAILTVTNVGIFRENPEATIHYLGFCKIDNVIIGIIPFSIFAMSALPAVLTPGKLWLKAILVAAAAAAFFLNLTFLTRSAIVGAAIAWICLLPSLVAFKNKKARVRDFVVEAGCILTACAIISLFRGDNLTFLLDRISETFEDERISLWKESLFLLTRYPVGGGISNLTTMPWAHNLFLDLGLMGGIPVLIAAVALYWFIIVSMRRSLQNRATVLDPLSISLFGGFICAFVCSMLCPPQEPFLVFMNLVGSYILASPKVKNGFIVMQARRRRMRAGQGVGEGNPSCSHPQ